MDALSFRLEDAESTASDKDLMNAAMFFMYTNELKKASQAVQKVIDNNPANLNAIALKGWIYLSAPKEDYVLKGS